MKKLLSIFCFILLSSFGYAQEITNPNYDAELAEKLGGDDYGMKPYVLIILKSGKNQSTDEEEINKAFSGHLKNINRLVEEDKLYVAGPIENNKNDYRGIFILNVPTLAEAEELLKTDPAISACFLDYDAYVWYGSAALGEYLPASDKIWKINP